MSEKRFELIEDDLEPLILDNKETMSVNEVVDLLNELSEENEQLRKRIAFFEQQSDEFEQYTAQTIQNMIANYRDDV